MIKQICILTKSYKHGGYCMAGIDLENKNWIRLVNSESPDSDEIKKEQMYIDEKPIECFDVIECDFVKKISNGCQTENWLLNHDYKWKYLKSLSLKEILNLIKIDHDSYFILNNKDALNNFEASRMYRSLFLFYVHNFKVDVSSYEQAGEIHFKFKCSFDYEGNHYFDISLTDPLYRDQTQGGICVKDVLIVASLPSVPYTDNLYYKFVAKVIPIEEEFLDCNPNLNKEYDGKSASPFQNLDLIVQTQQTPGTVLFENYEQLKAQITSGVAYYKNFEYTLDNFSIAQQHYEELKFVKNNLEKTKRGIINAYNQPLDVVVNRLEELINLIKEPFKIVDNFIKINEQEAKKKDIYHFARSIANFYGLQNHIDSILNSPAFFNDKWLLKSCEKNKWTNAVNSIIQSAAFDIRKIMSFEENDQRTNALAYYYQTLSMDMVRQFLNSLKVATDMSENVRSNAEGEIRNDVSVNVAQNTFQPLNCSNVYQNSDECTLIKNENNSQLIDVENLSDSEILNVVANSINPYTGEKITGIDNSLKRKLMGISSKLEMGEKREIINEIIKNIPCDERNSNVGRRWTEEEEQQLIDEFKQNLKIGEISKLHKRKAGGIKSRLKRLGLIDED